MNTFASKLVSILFLISILSLSACSDDKSTNPKEEGKSTPAAENNTLVSPENTYPVNYIETSINNHDKEIRYRLRTEEESGFIFNLRVHYPLPTDKSGEMTYITNLNELKENEFLVLNINTENDSSPTDWFTHGTTKISNKGKLNYKYNDNNTITFWTTNFEMSDDNINPTKTRRFSFRFTYNLDLNIDDEFGVSDGSLSPEN